MNTYTKTVNDEMATGGRGYPKLVMAVSGYGAIAWNFKSNEVVSIQKENYVKNGKWSHTKYELEIREDATVFKYIGKPEGKNWKTAIESFISTVQMESGQYDETGWKKKNQITLTEDQAKKAIRSIWPEFAANLDAEANTIHPPISDLFAAQSELDDAQAALQSVRNEIADDIRVIELRNQAEAIKAKIASMPDAKKRKCMSLDELKSLLS